MYYIYIYIIISTCIYSGLAGGQQDPDAEDPAQAWEAYKDWPSEKPFHHPLIYI